MSAPVGDPAGPAPHAGAAGDRRCPRFGSAAASWQRQVVSVALERSGRKPAYRDVLISVPRQSGKSSLALSLIVWRLLSGPDHLVLYSAQNRVAARRKLLHTWWPRLVRSGLGDRFQLFRGFGNESLTADTGSRLELLSATKSAGHGETTSLVIEGCSLPLSAGDGMLCGGGDRASPGYNRDSGVRCRSF